jgi:hypothetical protein
MDNLQWYNQTYNFNTSVYLKERREYLDLLLNSDNECDSFNEAIPRELVQGYYQNGQNLKCPNGTTSARGSQCIGLCLRPATQMTAISIMDPIMPGGVIRIDSINYTVP